MSAIHGIVCDFGGVLTSPLLGAFTAYAETSGIELEQLGIAIATVTERSGANPLYELEKGTLTEDAFLTALEEVLAERLGRAVSMHGFAAHYFAHLHPNELFIDYMRELRDRGLRMAICTNNVREWEPLWRAKLPVDEIFETVVDSAFVGLRKPDPQIYGLTLERLGLEPAAALLIDDIELNCEAARELGMQAVWFRGTDQAIGEIEAALAG